MKRIRDRKVIDSIIKQALVCRLAMTDGDNPYVVPMNFGYDGQSLYFHTVKVGRKIKILKKNNKVCFELDVGTKIEKADKICNWGTKYQSVIGFGKATLIEDDASKREALDMIVAHYSDKSFEYDPKMFNDIVIIKVNIESLSGRQSE